MSTNNAWKVTRIADLTPYGRVFNKHNDRIS